MIVAGVGYELVLSVDGDWLYWVRKADGARGYDRDDGTVMWMQDTTPIGIEEPTDAMYDVAQGLVDNPWPEVEASA